MQYMIVNSTKETATPSTMANVGIPFTQVPTTGCGGVSSSDHGYP